jgi:predicted lipid-binding transport protein (Tim44 family)
VVSSQAPIGVPGGKEAELMWTSDRRQSISRYKTPVGGGLIGLIAMIGMAFVLMIGSNFARQFLYLAIPAGGLVAFVLYWVRHRRQNSYIPFL